MRRYSRVREKLTNSLYRMATWEGDVRDRLRGAHRVLNQLSIDEMPPELRDSLGSVMHRLTRCGPERTRDGEIFRDAVTHTMSRIRNSTGRSIASDIYRMHRAFVSAYGL